MILFLWCGAWIALFPEMNPTSLDSTSTDFDPTSQIYRLAYIPDGTVPDCAYRLVLPDPAGCPFIGYHPSRVLQLLQFITMNASSVRLRVLPADGFSARDAADNTSIMGQIVHGLADLSPALMSLTTVRASQANYIEVEDGGTYLIYKNPTYRPSVKLAELFPPYIVYPMIFMLIFFIPIRVLRVRWPFHRNRNNNESRAPAVSMSAAAENNTSLSRQISTQGNHGSINSDARKEHGAHLSYDLKEYVSRFGRQTELYLSLFIVIILGIMQTDLVIKFNRVLTVRVFNTIDDFVEQIEQRRFVGITNSRVNFALVLDPVEFAGQNQYYDRLLAANQAAGGAGGTYAPRKVANVHDALRLLREHADSDAKPDFVFVTGAGTMSIIQLNATNLCDLTSKKAEYFGRGPQIMYYRKNLTFPRVPPGPGFIKMFEEDSKRLYRRTRILPNCTLYDQIKKSTISSSGYGTALSLSQMQGAFVIFGICVGGCLLALMIECFRTLQNRQQGGADKTERRVGVHDSSSQSLNQQMFSFRQPQKKDGRSSSVTVVEKIKKPSAAGGAPKSKLADNSLWFYSVS